MRVRRAHIGEDQPVTLLHRIPRLANALALAATLRLAGLVEAMAFRIEQPAVVAAADAGGFDAAVIQRGAAVAAACVQQSGPARGVAEQDQVLAEGAHLARRGAGVGGKADRMPVAAQQLAHRRAAPDFGQFRVVGRRREHIRGALVVSLTGFGFHQAGLHCVGTFAAGDITAADGSGSRQWLLSRRVAGSHREGREWLLSRGQISPGGNEAP